MMPDDNEHPFFIECDFEYPAEIEEKTQNFPLCSYQTKADPGISSEFMNCVKPPYHKPTPKLMCNVRDTFFTGCIIGCSSFTSPWVCM